jgi:hypothetical protein
LLRSERRNVAAYRSNNGSVSLHEVARQPWKPVGLSFGLAVFHEDVLTV